MILSVCLIVYLLPIVAMLLSDGANWSAFDFIIAAVIIGFFGLLADAILHRVKTKRNRILILLFIALLFVAVWGELAVGLFGTPWAGN